MKKLILPFLMLISTSLYAVPHAVAFDFGGVMTGEPNRDVVVKFLRETFKFSPEEFEKANQEKRKAVKAGKTDEEFWLDYARDKAQLPNDWSTQFKTVMKEAIGANLAMYELVNELKHEGIPVAMLSNIDERLAKLVQEFGLYDPFCPVLLSYQIGVEKPDPRAYEILLEKLQLSANEVIFIDDKEENIEAAKKLGFDAILFHSADQITSELKKRGLLRVTLSEVL